MLECVKNQHAAGDGRLQLLGLYRLLCFLLDWAASLWQWQNEQCYGCFVLLRVQFSLLFHFKGVSSPFLSILIHLDEACSGNIPPRVARKEEWEKQTAVL